VTETQSQIDGILFSAGGGDASSPEVTLEQYKTFAETVERASSRRQFANSFFLTANSLLLTGAGLIAREAIVDTYVLAAVIAPALAGILLCMVWRVLIRNYRDLNHAKFEVIHAFERRLPSRPFIAELHELKSSRPSKEYLGISATESGVALIFFALHTVVFVASAVLLVLRYVS
jgi:hypothetical protein